MRLRWSTGMALVHLQWRTESWLLGMLEADQALEACGDVITWLRVACTARGGAGYLAPLPAVAYLFLLLLLPEAVSSHVAASKVLADLPGRQRPGVLGPGGAGTDVMVAAVQQLAENVGGIAARASGSPVACGNPTAKLTPCCCAIVTLPQSMSWPGERKQGQGAAVDTPAGVDTGLLGKGADDGRVLPRSDVGAQANENQFQLCWSRPGRPHRLLPRTHRGSLHGFRRPLPRPRQRNGSKPAQSRGGQRVSRRYPRDSREREGEVTARSEPGQLHPPAVCRAGTCTLPGSWHHQSVCKSHVDLGQHLWNTLAGEPQPAPTLTRHPGVVRRVPSPHRAPCADHHVRASTFKPCRSREGKHQNRRVFADCTRILGGDPSRSHPIGSLPPSVTVAPSATLPTATGTASVLATRSMRASVATRSTRASTVLSSGVSGLSTAPSAAAGRTDARTVGTYVANTARDAEFDALQLRPQMRDLLRLHPPPRNNRGDKFCVSWWGRGGCYSNCSRIATHRPFANSEERARLMAHVRAHLTTASMQPAAAGTCQGRQGAEAASAPTPWLLEAPPWPGNNDGAIRAPKRARVEPSSTRAEQTLRKYARETATKLGMVGDWNLFVRGERGRTDITENIAVLPHPAARLVDHLRRRGASVPLHTSPWTLERLQDAARRGSHKSAKDKVEFVCKEMLEFCMQARLLDSVAPASGTPTTTPPVVPAGGGSSTRPAP